MSVTKYDISNYEVKCYIYFINNNLTRKETQQIIDKLDDNTVLTVLNKPTVIKKLCDKIDSNEFCDGLNIEYAKYSLLKSDAVIIVSFAGAFAPVGFATINFEDNGLLYVDVICTHPKIKGGGNIIMKQLDYICLQIGLTGIYLESTSSKITFYAKYGYVKCDNFCNDMCLMIKGNYDEIIALLNYTNIDEIDIDDFAV